MLNNHGGAQGTDAMSLKCSRSGQKPKGRGHEETETQLSLGTS